MSPSSVDATVADATGRTTKSGQMLAFTLGNEQYALPILTVQEIRGVTAITPIPNAPHYVKGVMNLRGTIIPVMDLRTRIGLSEIAYDRFTVIIVIHVGEKSTGLIVDSVSDVFSIDASQIEPPPEAAMGGGNSLIDGLAKIEEKLIILLNERALVGDLAGGSY